MEAEPLLERSLAIMEKVYDPYHDTGLNNWAGTLYYQVRVRNGSRKCRRVPKYMCDTFPFSADHGLTPTHCLLQRASARERNRCTRGHRRSIPKILWAGSSQRCFNSQYAWLLSIYSCPVTSAGALTTLRWCYFLMLLGNHFENKAIHQRGARVSRQDQVMCNTVKLLVSRDIFSENTHPGGESPLTIVFLERHGL